MFSIVAVFCHTFSSVMFVAYLFVVVPIQEFQSDSENIKFKLSNHVYHFKQEKKSNLICIGDITNVDNCNVSNYTFLHACNSDVGYLSGKR